jgi:hypothetical protein
MFAKVEAFYCWVMLMESIAGSLNLRTGKEVMSTPAPPPYAFAT